MTGPATRLFIEQNLRLRPAPSVPEIRLYTAHSGSGLGRLLGNDDDGAAGDDDAPPYWAYHWAGGAVLARYILDRPEVVAGKRVVDLGAGSGVVAIAAALRKARHIVAVDIDPIAAIAAEMNAAANGVAIETLCRDITSDPPPDADLVLAGDVFYEAALAGRVLPFLRMCRAAGIDVLIGDPGRSTLPRQELKLLAEYQVADFGDARDSAGRMAQVYTL